MKYNITYTAHITGSVDVEADSYDEAHSLAREIAEEEAPTNDHLELDYTPPSEGEIEV